eukprot:scaffold43883_cov32-Tisochrysis_lutea.AAC.2
MRRLEVSMPLVTPRISTSSMGAASTPSSVGTVLFPKGMWQVMNSGTWIARHREKRSSLRLPASHGGGNVLPTRDRTNHARDGREQANGYCVVEDHGQRIGKDVLCNLAHGAAGRLRAPTTGVDMRRQLVALRHLVRGGRLIRAERFTHGRLLQPRHADERSALRREEGAETRGKNCHCHTKIDDS